MDYVKYRCSSSAPYDYDHIFVPPVGEEGTYGDAGFDELLFEQLSSPGSILLDQGKYFLIYDLSGHTSMVVNIVYRARLEYHGNAIEPDWKPLSQVVGSVVFQLQKSTEFVQYETSSQFNVYGPQFPTEAYSRHPTRGFHYDGVSETGHNYVYILASITTVVPISLETWRAKAWVQATTWDRETSLIGGNVSLDNSEIFVGVTRRN